MHIDNHARSRDSKPNKKLSHQTNMRERVKRTLAHIQSQRSHINNLQRSQRTGVTIFLFSFFEKSSRRLSHHHEGILKTQDVVQYSKSVNPKKLTSNIKINVSHHHDLHQIWIERKADESCSINTKIEKNSGG